LFIRAINRIKYKSIENLIIYKGEEQMIQQIERKEKIVGFMREKAYKPLKFDELKVVLGVPKSDVELFSQLLHELELEGRIYKTKKDRYGVPERMNLVVGTLIGNERGYGFLNPDDEDMKDVFIAADNMGGAMHNDRVVARLTQKVIGDKKAEGEVIKILQRANETLVGTFEQSEYFGFVVPDDRRISGDIFIPKAEFNGAQPGQKVVVRITQWPDHRRNAEGQIIEIIGYKDQPGVDIVSIMKSYGLKSEFPESVIKEAESIEDFVPEEMMRGRRDLRNVTMVTIDGEDAKDLDDAVSLEKIPDGGYRLGVHIADVSHYVTEGSELNKEALKRGASVYLVDRVVPMLPQKLSNGICSLNKDEDRLAFSVIMDIDSTGKVYNHEIFESVINVNERMTYTEIYKIIAEDDKELIEKYDYLYKTFKNMEELAIILKKRRMARGAIDFNFDEARVILDEDGKPIDIIREKTTIANSIIEEFMLICNETVAERFHWAETPFVFRIHEEPDTEKIQAFAEFSSNLGYPLKGINKVHPKALQDILEKVKDTDEETILSTVMLRSLAKARYSNQNIGHFGLAARFYCHFTAPIRRYPDLIIHRIIKEYLKGTVSPGRDELLKKSVHDIARHCSERERAAVDAERETEDLKKVEYMKSKEGEVFEGIVSNVTPFGMYVELPNTIEGLVRMSDMYDDYYIYDDKHYFLIGERTRKIYKIGQKVAIIVAKANIEMRQLDFLLADTEYENGSAIKTPSDEEKWISSSKKKNGKKKKRNMKGN
jgi:ribonuclease R